MWADQAISQLSEKEVYHREELLQALKHERKNMSESSYRWELYDLEVHEKIFRVGYDSYVTAKSKVLPVYHPIYTDSALSLEKAVENEFPGLSFVLVESVLLNEFLNHQIAQNTIYLQVDREISSYIFGTLRDECQRTVLYKPSKSEFNRYWTPGCIVVLDLVSQFPVSSTGTHEITGEKFLIDIIADKSIAATYSPSELPLVYQTFETNYRMDESKLKRYAGRRGKTDIVKKYLGES